MLPSSPPRGTSPESSPPSNISTPFVPPTNLQSNSSPSPSPPPSPTTFPASRPPTSLPNSPPPSVTSANPLSSSSKSHRPDCIISDIFYPWTNDLGYPRIAFHGIGFFSCVVPGTLAYQKLHESVTADDEPFVVGGLPHSIEMTRSQLPGFFMSPDSLLISGVVDWHHNCYGVVMNSFYELEPEYADIMKMNANFKIWHIGPVSLSGSNTAGRLVESDLIGSWLNGKNPSSVLYVCFGSSGKFTTPQLREIASGLEDSGHPFIWAVNKSDENLPEGFEERVKGKGLVIKGWAPQVMILNHQAVGGFMTHCGWNSCLEGASAGLPMITWPMFGDQFVNERLIVDVVGMGIGIGTKVCSAHEEERTVVKGEDVAKAVRGLMGGDEAERRRKRAREVREKARRAVEEGGSSYSETDRLVEDIINLKTARVQFDHPK
nr:UDP-glycosyltransferase [Paris polyphylla]